MPIAKSKLTTQGQISVPAEIRKKLGLGPGSILEWDEQNDQVVVRRVGLHTSEDIHRALFPDLARQPGAGGLKDGIRKYMRKRHARG